MDPMQLCTSFTWHIVEQCQSHRPREHYSTKQPVNGEHASSLPKKRYIKYATRAQKSNLESRTLLNLERIKGTQFDDIYKMCTMET